MKFRYEQGGGVGSLSIKTDHGVSVEVGFDLGEGLIYIDGYEMSARSDTMEGLSVAISGKYVSLREVIDSAINQYPAIITEVEQEQADDEAHEREMSSPEATGRV